MGTLLSWVSRNFYKVLIGFDQSKPLVQPKVEGRTPEHHGSCCFFTLKGFGLASRHENALSYLLLGYS